VEELLRERIRGIIELMVEQELEEALVAANSARVGEQRAGYRHGHRARTFGYQPRRDHYRDAAGTNGR